MTDLKLTDPLHLADDFFKEWFNESSFVLAHTSGSTGSPKNIRLSKEDMMLSARATCDFFSINSDSTLFCPLSTDYIAGKMMIVRALVSGARLIMSKPSNILNIDYTDSIDLLPIVPSQIQSLLTAAHLSHIRNVIVGGAPICLEQRKKLMEAPFQTFSTYGMTETCSHIALGTVTLDRPIYHALPGITFSVTEESCLIIESPQYSFSPLITKDIVDLIDSRSFLWKGRADNVINSAGVKIHPEEIEAEILPVLSQFKSIKDYYITKRPSSKWGEEMILVLESDEPIDKDSVMILIREIMTDKKKMPKEIIVLTSFRRTANGKVLRY
ncbi:MAG: AMP-binding protein [Paramuribaculum sp.]|nr:AMP-binding protein [Paramuribaculum sp.]